MKKQAVTGRMVVYLCRQQLAVYDPRQQHTYTLDFNPEVVQDLTIVNPEEYKKLVSKALAQFKLEKQKVLVVLAKDTYFTQPIQEVTKSAEGGAVKTATEQLKELRESAPFVNVYARIIRIQRSAQAVAVSRDLFEPLLEVLAEQGFEVTTLVPELVASVDLSQSGLTAEIGEILSNSVEKMEEFDFLESIDKPKQFTTTPTTPEAKKRTGVLAGVFILLLALLGVVYWYVNYMSVPPLPPAPPLAPVAPLVPPELTPELVASSGAEEMTETESATEAAEASASGLLENTDNQSDDIGEPVVAEPTL